MRSPFCCLHRRHQLFQTFNEEGAVFSGRRSSSLNIPSEVRSPQPYRNLLLLLLRDNCLSPVQRREVALREAESQIRFYRLFSSLIDLPSRIRAFSQLQFAYLHNL